MAKAASLKIKLLSTADTGYFYVTKKNARTKTEKFTFKKYDPVARKHVEFKETARPHRRWFEQGACGRPFRLAAFQSCGGPVAALAERGSRSALSRRSASRSPTPGAW